MIHYFAKSKIMYHQVIDFSFIFFNFVLGSRLALWMEEADKLENINLLINLLLFIYLKLINEI